MSNDDLFDKIQDNAIGRMSWNDAKASNLSIQKEVLKEGYTIRAQHQAIELQQETVMVFADHDPAYNWGHRCSYMLYGASDGELYGEVPATFPPYMTEIPETYNSFHAAFLWPHEKHLRRIPELRLTLRFPVGKRYAVLFSGASNNRHVNDLEFLYRTLVDIYNFPSDQIYVLNYDGTINYSGGPKPVGNWPGDDTAYRMPIHATGNKSDLEGVLNDLKTRLKDDDLLLIHTNNHGGHNGTESYLCTYSAPSYTASDFAAKLAELPTFSCLMVMMEQCHSGGFNSPVIANSPATNTTIASACGEHASSIGGPEFDPFARDWISAVKGTDPYEGALAFNPDADGSGKVSAKEAFDYANTVKDPYDTPVYNESSTAAGGYHLGQRWKYLWYRDLVLRLLRPYHEILPPNEFHAKLYTEVAPRLREISEYVDRRSEELQREIEPRIEDLIRNSME